MQTIGRGAQFEVTSDGDRVFKSMHTVQESADVYRSWGYGLLGRDLENMAATVLDDAVTSLQGVRAILETNPNVGPSLANPIIEDDLSYAQDRVTTMGEALRKNSLRGARYLIDQYVELNLFHASYGFADRIFNVTINHGVNDDSEVVLIDLGELTFDKEVAAHAAATKRWRTAYPFWAPAPFPTRNFPIPLALRPYYYRRMSAGLTSEAIEQNWPMPTAGGNG